jgi:hypothetical protein
MKLATRILAGAALLSVLAAATRLLMALALREIG